MTYFKRKKRKLRAIVRLTYQQKADKLAELFLKNRNPIVWRNSTCMEKLYLKILHAYRARKWIRKNI